MLFDIIKGAEPIEIFVELMASLVAVFCILPVHEFAHAFVAAKLGDDTARLSGRLTLDPLAHIDWLGAAMIVLVGFGYAKPVPVNILNTKLKNKKISMALIALAGPVSNLLMALISTFIFVFIGSRFSEDNMAAFAFFVFFEYSAIININLAVFNLIPVPPLDGSRVLTAVLPDRAYFKLMQYERYFRIIILVLLVTNILSTPLSLLTGVISGWFISLASLILGA